jgi:hypothetical protein
MLYRIDYQYVNCKAIGFLLNSLLSCLLDHLLKQKP